MEGVLGRKGGGGGGDRKGLDGHGVVVEVGEVCERWRFQGEMRTVRGGERGWEQGGSVRVGVRWCVECAGACANAKEEKERRRGRGEAREPQSRTMTASLEAEEERKNRIVYWS